MAKRFTDTDLWDKEWFMALKPRLKCLVKFVRDKCDLAGVWSPNWKAAKMYIDEDVTEKELLEIDGGNQFIKLPGGKIFCVDFIKFQYGELSTKSPVHRKIISLLASHNLNPDQLKTLSKYPINRVQEKEEEKEKDKEEEKGLKILPPAGEFLKVRGKVFSMGFSDYFNEHLQSRLHGWQTQNKGVIIDPIFKKMQMEYPAYDFRDDNHVFNAFKATFDKLKNGSPQTGLSTKPVPGQKTPRSCLKDSKPLNWVT